MTTRINIVDEVKCKLDDGDFLCYQKVFYVENGKAFYDEISYRFIRRGPEGNLKAQRGQAAIPTHKHALKLIEAMQKLEERPELVEI